MARTLATATLLAAALLAAAPGAAGAPALPKPGPDGWISLFNGKDLTGWNGDPAIWRVENGYISGKTMEKVKANTFLICAHPFSDFVLELDCMLIKGTGFTNSGIQYRSKVLDPAAWSVGGYQADMGEDWWGACYEERGRGVLWKPAPEAKKAAKPYNEWNRYVIEAKGSVIKQTLNGVVAGTLDDQDAAKRSGKGVIALQYHKPGGFEVRFRNIRIKPLK
jgi:hypothetical protein